MRRDVEFRSDGELVRAHLYLPEAGDGPWPVVVMAGGWCYVKELVQPDYAKAFVDAGLAALVFDYRNLGESEGRVRQHIDPWAQIEDYRNAITFVETLDEIDAGRIGIWGISYSGGHVLITGAIDPRVRCIVSNIPVVDGWKAMQLVHGSLGFRQLEAVILEDRHKRFTSGEHGYMPMSTTRPHEELSTWPFPEVTPVFAALQASDAPNHEHRNTIASVELLLNYSVFPYLGRILDVPTLVTVADHDDITRWDDEIRAYNEIPTSRKKLFVFDETSHMTLYSNKSRLEIAAEQARLWFVDHLIDAYAQGQP
jgi:fermentation-respiration switch protein FrsA (DUF1100 family)